jgi:hypothetical protein
MTGEHCTFRKKFLCKNVRKIQQNSLQIEKFRKQQTYVTNKKEIGSTTIG